MEINFNADFQHRKCGFSSHEKNVHKMHFKGAHAATEQPAAAIHHAAASPGALIYWHAGLISCYLQLE